MEDVRSTKKGCSIRPPPTGPGIELELGMVIRDCTAAATRGISESPHICPSIYSLTM
jgi:hypothetical protein